ncbi:MAG: 50S ribosomal protein L25 [Candidatus Saganbacteria bacterium]|nr:50S ribosomal protein L25 [Candidatus Saganbacteria bacterium]
MTTKTKVEIKADTREILGKNSQKVRRQGLIPAVVYGRKFKATAVSLDAKEFTKKVLRSGAGRNLIFSLKMSDAGKGKSVPVITHAIQRDPLDDSIIHLDLMHIIMDEKIKTRVRIELLGTPIGVKEEGGVLVHGLREVEVKCLPGEIPDKFEIDVSALKINASLHISDLKPSGKVEILSHGEEMIAQVSPPTKEEEVAPVVAVPEGAVVPEGEEGAAAVAEAAVKEKAAPGAAPAEKGAEKPAKKEKE